MTTLVLSRGRASRWNILAVLAAVTTALAVYSYLSWLRGQIPVAGPLIPMVVAARDIDSGMVLKPGMLKLVKQPGKYLPAQVLRDTGDALGRVAAVPILRGDPVTSRKIGRTGGASSAVPPGMRAYLLSSQSLTGAALEPRSGDRVDVLATLPAPGGDATTVTILRSARVTFVAGAGTSSGKVASQLGVGSSTRRGVALLVTPEQAETLARSESLGKITLVLAPDTQAG